MIKEAFQDLNRVRQIAVIAGEGRDRLGSALADDQGIDSLIRSAVKDASSPMHGRDPDEIRAQARTLIAQGGRERD